ncbi:DUF92 domain-containing protein [Bacillus sp. CRN 9]|uniref:DUF92 domain-containing protein n=1 Tax=Cytobacillus horneckiae TaxID=549687 RepID=UPI001561E01B|nr:DUF92 domain-containing protein [Bacillus sp. CRN 9]
MMSQIFLLLFVAIISIAGNYLRALTLSGSVAAFFVGVSISLGFGLKGLLLLGFFFASSSLWSKYKKKQKEKIEDRHEKGSTRDWHQVIANGGIGAIFSLLYMINPHPIFLIGFIISLASANSDTWASEIGSLSKRSPIFIRTFKAVDAGTSGAVSLLGTIAALAGSFTVACLSMYLFALSPALSFFIFIFGFLGNMFDTLIGAYLQVIFKCKQCGAIVESKRHCGKPTEHVRGFAFLNNDIVNFLSALLAVLCGIFIISIFY